MSSGLVYSYTPLNSEEAKIIDLQVLENRKQLRFLRCILYASAMIWLLRKEGSTTNIDSESHSHSQIERLLRFPRCGEDFRPREIPKIPKYHPDPKQRKLATPRKGTKVTKRSQRRRLESRRRKRSLGDSGSKQRKLDLDYRRKLRKYHRRLEKKLPDWPERVAYQKKQKKLYQSAMLKKQEASRFARTKKEREKFWTPEEKDAVDYKLGRGRYLYYQDPSTPPNIFDRRQTLLVKMYDWDVQKNYLKSYRTHH